MKVRNLGVLYRLTFDKRYLKKIENVSLRLA